MNIKFIRGYFISFFKFYLFRKLKLLLTIALTVIIFIWINTIYNNLISYLNDGNSRNPLYYLSYLANAHEALFILFIKPIFVYIAGIIIIKNI